MTNVFIEQRLHWSGKQYTNLSFFLLSFLYKFYKIMYIPFLTFFGMKTCMQCIFYHRQTTYQYHYYQVKCPNLWIRNSQLGIFFIHLEIGDFSLDLLSNISRSWYHRASLAEIFLLMY